MSRATRRTSLSLVLLAILLGIAPAAAQADFGMLPGTEGFSVAVTGDGGVSVDRQAGSHPFSLVTEVNLRPGAESPSQPGVHFSDGDLRELQIDLPPGLIENPTAVPQCTQAAFHTPRASPFGENLSGESCPDNTQIGTIAVHTTLGAGATQTFGVFNLEPTPGSPSMFGFSPFGAPITISPRIREAGSEYGLTLQLSNFPQQFDLLGFKLTIWGTPWDLSHDGERGNCLNESEPQFPEAKCSVGNSRDFPRLAYLTLPTSCAAPIGFGLRASSWQGESASAEFAGEQLQECNSLHFEPVPVGHLNTSRASSPSGFEFNIQNDVEGLINPARRAESLTQRAVLTFPVGMTINPSVGSGLGVCSSGQFAAETINSAPGSGCPNDSKIGELTVRSPLFEGEITGGMFLAEPDDPAKPGKENPFDSMLALYLVAKSPQRGVMIRLAGQVLTDPSSGQLTAIFEGLPQLPYSVFSVHFRDGQRTPLATPPSCGTYTASMTLSPWIDPTEQGHFLSEFPIDAGIGGGPCPSGIPPFRPGAVAGTANSNAGSFSPFYLHLTRSDEEQEITSYSAQLPPGLLGQLKGIPYCPDAAIAEAKTKSGFAELREPSCPAASSIGHTVSGYGLGSVLAYAPGGLYLAGPYHGAPLSIVAIDSAVVGPFDLGVVVVRSAIKIDPRSAQVTVDSAGSDPIPHILDGIPLHLRDIRVYIDRPGFTLNPTNCDPLGAVSLLSGSGLNFADPADDVTASGPSPFQVSNCSALGYRPGLRLRLKGGTKRGTYPALKAVFRPRPSGDANTGSVSVTLPPSLFLAQEHIDSICTRGQFAAERCPAGSLYGHARAITPLLGYPLEGPVYLRSSDNPLPDLVADLSGGGIRIEVDGRIDSVGNAIRARFEGIPDAPVTTFTMALKGGKRGLLVNAEDLCLHPPRAKARMTGQNNRTIVTHPRMHGRCRR